MGCIGYKNYAYFLQFAFWASLHMTLMALLITANLGILPLGTEGMIYYVSGAVMAIFGWVVFFLYGTMALKGVTIIEASQMFVKMRNEVGFA
jgi:hypothetical protein